ncbi:hypothetical protein SAMN02799630_04326 [Paenibacillus sp. UNCCL117]|uniref:hypothetical protein n=1 Tax=unclassified Paenibacillus TaxID=185978 RepID=UPI00088BDEF1|nr:MULTISPECIES: hypothetical protein [unclassified Paenibacillus]SDD97407.1 hypothetical protein SAMN04488602_11668 [Paenibacillus sp. cl123]SFW56205.1 hypothetical protein SAMN02799630_04326 [Paenibacillus sp. UNCCL117]
MRDENQVKRKLNELLMQRKIMETQAEAAAGSSQASAAGERLERLDEQILLLEWVLNEPRGRYHA